MKTQFAYIRADEDLWQAQQFLAGSGLPALPVVEGDMLCGMLTPADIRAARAQTPFNSGETPLFISGGNIKS
jgi:predicted transcriptional regulator